MRILKIILSILVAVVAVVGGLFAAAIVALASLAILLTRRFLSPPAGPSPTPSQSRVRHPPKQAGDAIEVTATEIPVEENATPPDR